MSRNRTEHARPLTRCIASLLSISGIFVSVANAAPELTLPRPSHLASTATIGDRVSGLQNSSVGVVLTADSLGNGLKIRTHLHARLETMTLTTITTTQAINAAMLKRLADRRPESVILAIDLARGGLVLVRRADRLIVSRDFDSVLATKSPYAVAVAAAELVELALNREISVEHETTRPSDAKISRDSFSIMGGVLLSGQTKDSISLIQPELGGRIRLYLGKTDFFTESGIYLAPSVSETSLESNGSLASRLRRYDGEFRAGLGWTTASMSMSFDSGFGISALRISAEDAGSARMESSDDMRLISWITAGFSAQYQIAENVGILSQLGLVWVPEPVRFFARSEEIYREGPLRIRTSLGVAWDLTH
jgi:hypothetical protein